MVKPINEKNRRVHLAQAVSVGTNKIKNTDPFQKQILVIRKDLMKLRDDLVQSYVLIKDWTETVVIRRSLFK